MANKISDRHSENTNEIGHASQFVASPIFIELGRAGPTLYRDLQASITSPTFTFNPYSVHASEKRY